MLAPRAARPRLLGAHHARGRARRLARRGHLLLRARRLHAAGHGPDGRGAEPADAARHGSARAHAPARPREPRLHAAPGGAPRAAHPRSLRLDRGRGRAARRVRLRDRGVGRAAVAADRGADGHPAGRRAAPLRAHRAHAPDAERPPTPRPPWWRCSATRRRARREARAARPTTSRACCSRPRSTASASPTSSSTCSSCCSSTPAATPRATSSRAGCSRCSRIPSSSRPCGPTAALLPGAIEEMLRFVPPVVQFRRTLTRDAELHGQKLREGEKVVMFYPAANRDEAVFSAPDRFDVRRDPNPHLAFGGGGAHYCLGANLARLEIRCLFEAVLDRLARARAGRPGRAPALVVHRWAAPHARQVRDRGLTLPRARRARASSRRRREKPCGAPAGGLLLAHRGARDEERASGLRAPLRGVHGAQPRVRPGERPPGRGELLVRAGRAPAPPARRAPPWARR